MPAHMFKRRHADSSRLGSSPGRRDHRKPAERDRDRILYSNAFQRLSGVSQVASPAEGQVIHNRLTHSLKVAQVARRLTEKLLRTTDEATLAIQRPDPDVAEAAALAHDLGHPPFGHVGEKTLNRVIGAKDPTSDGYEGNAQSFRIAAKLEVRSKDHLGLDLTRATLNGVLKYPTLKCKSNQRKWGAYLEEKEDFDWARNGLPDGRKTIEAEIMDWADDITYAMHDVEDFYCAGLIPLNLLIHDAGERDRFLKAAYEKWKLEGGPEGSWDEYEQALMRGRDLADLAITETYDGSRAQQASLRDFCNQLIARYVNETTLESGRVGNAVQLNIPTPIKREVEILKELCFAYVIQSPELLTQQKGYGEIIETLFSLYYEDDNDRLVPVAIKGALSEDASRGRRAADIVSALSDEQAVHLFNRVTGNSPGSIRDFL